MKLKKKEYWKRWLKKERHEQKILKQQTPQPHKDLSFLNPELRK
jgi:hypothetical protein